MDNINLDKLPIVKKAWLVGTDWSNYMDCRNVEVVYGSKGSEARTNYLKEYASNYFHYKNYPNYIDVKVKRYKEGDVVLYEGEKLTKENLKDKFKQIEYKENLKKLLADNPNSKCYIYKARNGAYYRSNCCGYSNNLEGAGIYDIEEAVKVCMACSERDGMRIELINSKKKAELIASVKEKLKYFSEEEILELKLLLSETK